MSSPPPSPPPPPSPCDFSNIVENSQCNSTSVNYRQLESSIAFSLVGAVLILILWAYLRGATLWKPIYHKRATQISDLLLRPYPLKLHGLHRIWSYLEPVFTVNDGYLLISAGMDALMLVRFTLLGLHIFIPLSIVVVPILLPLYYNGGSPTTNQSIQFLNTMGNVPLYSNIFYAPFVLFFVSMFYIMWVLYMHYNSYRVLRAMISFTQTLHEWELRHGPVSGPCTRILNDYDNSRGKAASFGWQLLTMLSPYFMYQEDKRQVALFGKFKQATLIHAKQYGTLESEDLANLLDIDDNKDHSDVLNGRHSKENEEDEAPLYDCEKQEMEKKQSIEDKRQGIDGAATMEERVHALLRPKHVPDGVCPWWLLPEETPPEVNSVIKHGGALLGKSLAQHRKRIQGMLGNVKVWVPAKHYVVLYRDAGPLPSQEWQDICDVQNQIKNHEDVINTDPTVDDLIVRFHRGHHSGSGGVDGITTEVIVDDDIHDTKHNEGVLNATDRSATTRLPRLLHHDRRNRKEMAKYKQMVGSGKALEGVLTKLFPTTFQGLVPVYDHKATDMAIHAWDHSIAELERVVTELKKIDPEGQIQRNILSDGGAGKDMNKIQKDNNGPEYPVKRVSKISSYYKSYIEGIDEKKRTKTLQRVATLIEMREQLYYTVLEKEEIVVEERKKALAKPLGTAYFALFTSKEAALIALQGNIGEVPTINMKSEPAPGPDEINWEGMWPTWSNKWKRTLWILFPMVFLMIFPIGIITGILSSFSFTFCQGNASTNSLYWSAYCAKNVGAFTLRFLFQTVLPIVISTFWDTYVMPLVFYILIQNQRFYTSFSALDGAIIRSFYAYDVLNTFLGAVLGGGAITQLGGFLQNDGQDLYTLIGQALPSASNWFINYLVVHAIFVNLFRFVWPHDGTVLFVFFRMFGMHVPKCPRDEWIIRSTPSYRGGRHFGSFLLTYIICFAYLVISPQMIIVALVYFFTSFITWRYSALHFYESCYLGDARTWEELFDLLVWTIFIAGMFTGSTLIAVRAYVTGTITLILSPMFPAVFRQYCMVHVVRFVKTIPLQSAAAGPTIADIDELRRVYTPPPLRRGAIGWFPEWGKVWEKYGIPRYGGF